MSFSLKKRTIRNFRIAPIVAYFGIFVFALWSVQCKKNAASSDEILSIEDLLVKNNDITGWSYDGATWQANNISELTTYINGGAEIYQRHGFIEAAHQTYRGKIDNADRQLKLTIYNQGNENQAKATYEDPDIGLIGALDWADGAGQEAHYIRYSGLSQALTFYSNSYFVYLEITYDTEESLNILKQFALNVNGRIK
jgi:hypothetical protein